MVRITHWWLAGMSVWLLLVNIAEAQFVPQAMVVRVYNSAGLSRDDITAAQRVADEILGRAGIGVRWRECRTERGPSAVSGDSCADTLQARELIARVVPGRARHYGSALGYALVDGVAQAGTIVTVFAEHVAGAAARLRVDRPTLLGRTLVHELGHLLLGTNSHTGQGVMRAWWSDAALRRREPGREWRFSDREARDMTMALDMRGISERALAGVPPAERAVAHVPRPEERVVF